MIGISFIMRFFLHVTTAKNTWKVICCNKIVSQNMLVEMAMHIQVVTITQSNDKIWLFPYKSHVLICSYHLSWNSSALKVVCTWKADWQKMLRIPCWLVMVWYAKMYLILISIFNYFWVPKFDDNVDIFQCVPKWLFSLFSLDT